MKVTPYGTFPFRTSQVGTGEAPRRGVQSSGSGTASEFARGLGRALDELSKVQDQADAMVTKLVTGQAEDIHSVILAVERANLSIQMAVQVRNKVLEAYQEIMHMQV
jgi:flagellar hook-basal body complex protein FliE